MIPSVEENVVAVTRVSPRNRFVEFSREETEQSIAERFEKQVCKSPRRIAVQTSHVQLTYNDLNKLANRLARVLLQQFRDDRPIAILMEHDAQAVVAIFGALKASKIFIPLDPALPDARIGQILSDSGTNSIVTNDKCLHTALDLSEGSRRIVNVDHYDASINTDNLDLKISPDSIGYVLYTSGSTGKPKGVIRTHRNDLRNIRHLTNSFSISDDDRITLLGSYSTGQGTADIYCALLNGATLFPRNLKTEGFNGLADWLMQERITFYHSAATLFRHFVHNLSGHEIFPELRIVRLGGEAVSWKDVESYKKHFPDNCVLANELSCSEANIITQFLINKTTEINMTVPVGYPVEDKEVFILDEKGDPLGPGEIGEIAVRTRFLSPGYWNRPDLTELVFIPDRESLVGRIYLTGDLGRKSSNGCIEHLGRKDTQVKIRGYRVECYEVELALLQNPGVAQAFVTHREDARSETYLVAYIVPDRGVKLTVTEMRACLSAHVPEYMVPKAFVFLETLPLTPTGKIDRRALPEPAAVRPPLDVPYATPRGPVEESVAKLCSQILGITVIGVHDNLFDLGGHSISAMQIVARVMKTFRVNVPLKRFYDSPTIAGLSAIIATSRRSTEACEDSVLWQDLFEVPTVPESARRIENFRQNSPISLPSIRVVTREGPILPSIAQEPILMLARLFPGLHQFNIPAAYRLRGPLNVVALKESLTRLIDRHEALRTVFPVENGKHYQSIIESLSINLDVIDLHELPETERESKATELSREESQRPFDLAHGPLFRVKIFRLSVDDHILAVTVHQVISDGWSMMLFFRDLAELYRGSLHADQLQLPDLPIQYADYTIWQREALQEGLMDGQLSYWKRQLSEPMTPLEFSTGVRRSDEMNFFTARKRISISAKLFQSVKSLAHQEKTTPFMVLLTALNILLSRYLGQDDIRVGTLVANRHRSEVENLIGHCVNTIILRTRISENLNFKKLAQLVREITVSAHSNQDIPFEVLLQTFENETTIRCDMLSPVLFIFQSEPQPINLPHLTVSVLDEFQNTAAPEVAITMFDLVLSLKEQSEGLTGFLVYKMFVFDEMTVNGFIRNFENLLERIAYDPNESVSALSSLVEI
jgi:amino acid adenylation domain-containing protein